ncbi:hypothetical protein F0562_026013 [Nyssa sinensis]|uniref:Uncharacterized protein n=1 Tax=Nyssa sinensis TaxID=561372 RepID=A0A5J5BDM4_9ASTE|nr:hypothetical protein F0562_026013 [Nyssa sinensis]
MHLWPSMRIRDSFKLAYLRKLEWNQHRMKSEKRQSPSSNQEKLLDNDEGDAVLEAKADSENHAGGFLSGRHMKENNEREREEEEEGEVSIYPCVILRRRPVTVPAIGN